MPEVAVIVVSWNTRDELLACAASVFAARDVDLELWVVDNGSSNDSVAALRAAQPRARVIEAGENLGFAEGVNRGLAASASPWVLLLNSDAVLDDGALRCLLDEARAAGPELAVLQPRLLFKDDPGRLNSTGILLFSDGTARDRGFGERAAAERVAADVFGVTAGAALYRRAALEAVALPSGVLDRGFFMYLEDVDLAWRLRLAGYAARYVARARVLHRYQASSKRHGRDFVARRCRENRLRMLHKNGSATMLVRSARRTALDVAGALRGGGATGLGRVVTACARALAERGLVTRLARLPRRELERRWVTDDPTSRVARLRRAAARVLAR